jgi:hypothetical protein
MTHEIVLCPVKVGTGFVLVVNGSWFYASDVELLELVEGRRNECEFRSIRKEKPCR